MANSAAYLEKNRDKIAAYMRAYYLAHSTHAKRIPGAERVGLANDSASVAEKLLIYLSRGD